MFRPARKNYLHYSKKDRNGTLFLVALIGIIISLPFAAALIFKPLQPALNPETLPVLEADTQAVFAKASRRTNNYGDYSKSSYPQKKNYSETETLHLFYFDPNTLPVSGWQQLGLNEKNIATIQNYLSKGGKFYKPEDIRKIWGIKPGIADQLIPFIKIAEQKRSYTNEFEKAGNKKFPTPSYTAIDINTSDSAAWEALPGIGPKLSQRIVNFRKKLGGFSSIVQVAETYGLPDSTFQFIRPYLLMSNSGIHKININTAKIDDLKNHPYIRYHVANAIIQYRLQHGDFKNIQEIKKIMIIDDNIYEKISPYLDIEN